MRTAGFGGWIRRSPERDSTARTVGLRRGVACKYAAPSPLGRGLGVRGLVDGTMKGLGVGSWEGKFSKAWTRIGTMKPGGEPSPRPSPTFALLRREREEEMDGSWEGPEGRKNRSPWREPWVMS